MVSCLNTNAKLQNFLLKSKVFPQKMMFFIRKKAQKCTKNSMVGFMVGMMLGIMVGIWRFSVL
jgi:cellulose synthase/poly-beta-1,6-N-acetylglucosamine synthase-like glycosyltransferase